MPQPEPTPNHHPPVWAAVIADMHARDKLGIERYGSPLQPFNGRNAFTDYAEELLDAIVYNKQICEELKCLGKDLQALHALVVAAPYHDEAWHVEAVSLLKLIFQRNPVLNVDRDMCRDQVSS